MTTPIVALMFSLLAWIGANTGYQIPTSEAALPSIHLRTAHDLRVFSFGSEEKARENSSRDIRALYDRHKNRIYLYSEFDENNPEDRASVLHELVHFVQAFNGKEYPCVAEQEPEAYDLTDKWITETAAPVPLYDLFFVTTLLLNCYSPL